MVIHTERLTLRPWRETDAASLFAYASDPDVGPAAGCRPIEALRRAGRSFGRSLRRPIPLPFAWLRQTSPWAASGSCRLAASRTAKEADSSSRWGIGSPSRSGVEALLPKRCEPCSAMRSKHLAARHFGADTTRAITSRYAFSKNVASCLITLNATCPASSWTMCVPSTLRI